MTVRNHLLFSEAFFDQIRGETADLDNLRASLSTIQSTWRYHLPPPANWSGPIWSPSNPFPPDDAEQLRSKVVEQILAYVELTCVRCEADGRALSLYADWAMEDRTGLCLVLPYSAHIEGRDPQSGVIPKGRNYAQQLVRLLREHDLEWGVLTNGRHWRLYHRSELSPTETYLHVDLERIVASDDMQDYLVFHRFFSRSGFARQDGRQRLDLYKEQSDRATKMIEDHLSGHVEEIVRQLCQGLVESCRAAGEDVTVPETRTAIYKNALFLVYRLLFVLYAEARELLPLDLARYRAVCLRDLLAEVRDNHRQGMHYEDEDALWTRLQALFALIDQGDPAAGVPAYNGGLFDPGRRPFLTGHRMRNDYLQAALIRLTTIPSRGRSYDQDREPRPIDYRDLSVRHLGSLYEGLLEYSLYVVEGEPRVVRVSGKTRQYVPYSQAGKVRANETVLEVGEVYLSETAGERKATGSYYTPEDVVDYIVRNTVGVKLGDLKAEFYAGREIERQLADLADTPVDIPAHRQIQGALDDQFVDFVRQRVLDLKILDPAMGSGHFLVNATHAVANFLVEVLNETPWENPEIDTDVATWKRQAAERCIFGVDLNELAVELAKLCLWMTTAARGKPLTFLDHHLRWGNSLVGAWLKDVGVYPLARKESAQVFTLPLERFQVELDRVLAAYQELYAKSGDDVDEVREKARIYDEQIRPALQPYRELLDLHAGVYFDNGLDETTYARLGAAVSDPVTWVRLKGQRLGDLLALHVGRRWVHWELEFPEVFSRFRGGYDVVISNPPWGASLESNRLKQMPFYGVVDEDSSEFFVVLGLSLLTAGGRQGKVLPDTILSPSKVNLRRFVVQTYQLEQALDLGPDWFTSDIRMSTLIWICSRVQRVAQPYMIRNLLLVDEYRKAAISGLLSIDQAVTEFGQEIDSLSTLGHRDVLINTFKGAADQEVLEKMRSHSVALGQICDRGRGIELNKAGLVVRCPGCLLWNAPPLQDTDGVYKQKTCAHCGRKFDVDHQDGIRRLVSSEPDNQGRWHPYLDGDEIGRYAPRLYQYLDVSAEGVHYKSPTLYRSPKVLLRQAGVGVKAIYDQRGCYCPQSVYIYRVKEPLRSTGLNELLLLGVLLSRVFHFYIFKEFGEIDSAKAFVKLTHRRIETLPFPNMASMARNALEELWQLVSDLEMGMDEEVVKRSEDWRIEGIVTRLYGLNESDVQRMVEEFAKVHENQTLLGLFPEGVRGREQEIIERWVRELQDAARITSPERMRST